ncbi:MAG: DUF4272 domain-containing protein [Chloroflexota bacterium]
MQLNLAIYSEDSTVISEEKLQKLSPSAQINYQTQSIHIKSDTLDITINVAPSQYIQQQLSGLLGFAQQMGASEQVYRKLANTQQVLGVIVTSGMDDSGSLKSLILGITSEYDGYFFTMNAFYNAENQFVVGAPNAPKQFFPPDLPNETPLSVARKKRSMALLKDKNIPVIEHLPVIEDENQVNLRSQDDILYRALCLAIVATHGSQPDVETAKSFVADYQLQAHLSPFEQHFLEQDQLDERMQVNMSWHYEACYVLLWTLGFTDTLGEPDDICDVQALIDIVRFKTTDELKAQATLRPISEILDEADLIYRYSWASTNARMQQQEPPNGIHPSVVYERHYAFNWLRRYGDADWDDVSADT